MSKNWIGACLLSASLAALAMPLLFASGPEAKRFAKDQIEIKCEISMTNAAGQVEVIAAPTVVTVAGQAATISMTDAEGRTFEIKMTGQMLTGRKAADDISETGSQKAR